MLWIIPSIFLTICVCCNFNFNLFFLIMSIFVFSPCLYAYLIIKKRFKGIKLIKVIIFSFLLMCLNSVIVTPNSAMHYLGIKEFGSHDIDFFPLCIIVSILVFLSALCVIKMINIFRNW